MNIVISDTSDTPIYQQIFEQIRAQVLRGELPSGAPLPPIRTIAKELRISVITVKKAWEMLEGQGLIVTRVGRGSFVADMSAEQVKEARPIFSTATSPGISATIASSDFPRRRS